MQLIFRTDMNGPALAARVLKPAAALGVAAAILAAPALSAELPDLPAPLQEKVEAAARACAAFDNGAFALEWGAVERVDLDGDLRRDWVLNESGFACSTAASLYCGTGGCMSHFMVGEQRDSLLNRGWAMVDLGPNRVLLSDVHGSQCGGINPTPCVTASAWDAEAGLWRSAAAVWEE